MPKQIDFTSPLTRIFGFIVGVLVFTAAIIIGGFVLSAIIGLAVLAGTALYARIWWLRRKIRRAMQSEHTPGGRGDRVIETEYRVVEVTEERHGSTQDSDDARRR